MTPEETTPGSFSIGYLLLVTASFAVGVRLIIDVQFPLPARLVGVATCSYWLSKGIFAVSTTLPRRLREIVFLVGMPVYLCSVVCVVLGVIGIIALLIIRFAS